MRLQRLLPIAAMFAVSGVLAQASAPTGSTVPFPDKALRCDVVAGSMMGGFGDARLTDGFAETTRQIVDALNEELAGNNYDSESVFTAPTEASVTPPKAFAAFARSHCSQMIQVVFHGGPDKQGQFFAFDVNVLHFVRDPASSDPAHSVTTVADWNKDYRYPMTKEQLDTFRTGLFAHTVATDLMASGVLPKPPAGAALTEAQLRAEYARRVALAGNTEYHLRQIQLRTQADAQAALDRIRAGEAFEAVVRDVSVDAATKNNGGDAGWGTPLNYAPAMVSPIKSAAPHGLVGTPLQSPLGWHVVEVIDVRPFVAPPFDKLRGQIALTTRRQATIAAATR
jgi:parvulin-like peptidyl-prolyl isomerase